MMIRTKEDRGREGKTRKRGKGGGREGRIRKRGREEEMLKEKGEMRKSE